MRTIDLDSLPSYTKLELAVHQLDRAIALLLDQGDCISAITLAGAAEEILGHMVKLQGGTSAHQELIEECMELTQRVPGESAKPSEFHEMFAYFRNELKHYRQGSNITVNAECAYHVLDRAVENLRRLEVQESPAVQRYMNKRWSS
jgi:hypothetical protein